MSSYPLLNRSFHLRSSIALLTHVILLVLWAATAQAGINLLATVDKTHLSLEDTLELSVKINGTRESPSPVLPALPNFKVEKRGSASSIQIINGDMNSSITHRFLLTPKRSGTFQIGAIRLEMDGKHYESPPIQIIVLEQTSRLPEKDADVFAEAVISNPTPYLQEQTVLSYRLYRKVEVRNISIDAPLAHFRKLSIGDPREFSRIINGMRYYVSEVSFALFPMQDGVLTIPPATFQLEQVVRRERGRGGFDRFRSRNPLFNDPFFSGQVELERKNYRTQPVKVEVKPLPAEGKPKIFGNLVGQFKIESKLSQNTLDAGGTSTLTVTVTGNGNIGEVALTSPQAPDGLKIYEDQPKVAESPTEGMIEGSKTFSFALVPTKAGQFSLPPMNLDYFDPKSKRYQKVSTRKVSLTVRPGANQESTAPAIARSSSASTTPNAPALLPIHTDLNRFEAPDNLANQMGFWVAGFVLPPLGYLFFRIYFGQRMRQKQDLAYSRRKNAFTKASNRLKQLQELGTRDSKGIAREVSAIFRDYLGDRLNIHGIALTPGEVELQLKNSAFAENVVQAARDLLNQCETVEYAPVGAEAIEGLVDKTGYLIKDFENTK